MPSELPHAVSISPQHAVKIQDDEGETRKQFSSGPKAIHLQTSIVPMRETAYVCCAQIEYPS